MSKLVALKPRVSEKAYALSEANNTYVFDIPEDANKHSVAEAVAKQFEVGVVSVRIAAVPGKVKRSYRKRGKTVKGTRNNIRKAYVTLKEGDKLPIFSAIEEEIKAAKEAK